MDLNSLREERQKWLTWKNIAPYQKAIKALPSFSNIEGGLGVFSSRIKVVLDNASGQNLILSSQSLAHLKTGQYTYHLKFQ